MCACGFVCILYGVGHPRPFRISPKWRMRRCKTHSKTYATNMQKEHATKSLQRTKACTQKACKTKVWFGLALVVCWVCFGLVWICFEFALGWFGFALVWIWFALGWLWIWLGLLWVGFGLALVVFGFAILRFRLSAAGVRHLGSDT